MKEKLRDITAFQIMSKKVVTASLDESIRDILEKMLEYDIRHIPITEDGRLIAIISDRDIREYVSLFEEESELLENYAKLSEPVGKIAHTDVITVSPDTPLDEIIDFFIDEKIGAVPVVEPVSNHLKGIVSYIDVLKALRELTEQEN